MPKSGAFLTPGERRVRAALAVLLMSLVLPATCFAAVPFRIYDSVAGIDVNVTPESMLHTLSHDVFAEADGTVYVQTGDIPAMWLRDSAAQLKPYVPFVSSLPALAAVVRGAIEHNARSVVADRYANAFRADYHVWERKWEVDSLAYHVQLASDYWSASGDRSLFTPALHRSLENVVSTYGCEQHHESCSTYRHPDARHRRVEETGMVWGAFRPSDDPLELPFNIPQQMFAAVALRDVAELARAGYSDAALAGRATAMAHTIAFGVERFGRVYDFRYGWIYAYEVDGAGRALLIDDANVPNLLSAPLLGYVSSADPTYLNTRRFVLSHDNPYYYSGRKAAGIGSSHTPRGWAWPLAIATRAMTAQSRTEVAEQLALLAATASADGLVHESFDVDDASRFSRIEFGWANAVYAELLLRTAGGSPGVAREPKYDFASGEQDAMPVLVSGVRAWENRAVFLTALQTLFAPSSNSVVRSP